MCRSFKDLVDVLVIDPALREKCARFHSSTLFLRELFGLFGNKSTRDCHTILCSSFSAISTLVVTERYCIREEQGVNINQLDVDKINIVCGTIKGDRFI